MPYMEEEKLIKLKKESFKKSLVLLKVFQVVCSQLPHSSHIRRVRTPGGQRGPQGVMATQGGKDLHLHLTNHSHSIHCVLVNSFNFFLYSFLQFDQRPTKLSIYNMYRMQQQLYVQNQSLFLPQSLGHTLARV